MSQTGSRAAGAAATFAIAAVAGVVDGRLTGDLAPALIVFVSLVAVGSALTYWLSRDDGTAALRVDGQDGLPSDSGAPGLRGGLPPMQGVQYGNGNVQKNYFGPVANLALTLPRDHAAAVVESVAARDQAVPLTLLGRDSEVDGLLRFLDPGRGGPRATVVSAVSGLAGVGKTALAYQAASIAVERGWFPGAAVFADLHGYDPESRVTSGAMFGPLLHHLGVGGRQIPRTAGEQAAVYHQILAALADRGRPVLLVLDNVSGAGQVSGLLPVHRMHRVLITSRNALSDLDGANSLRLGVLGEVDAVKMLDEALRHKDPGDRRAQQRPESAGQLARLCGYLPLALRIAAALLAQSPASAIDSLIEELAASENLLLTLEDGERAVRLVFDESWRELYRRDEQAASLLRLLSVNPGPDVSTGASAALAGLVPTKVLPLLRKLEDASLVERDANDRWHMHDLVRLYAKGQAEDGLSESDRRAALSRLARFFYGSVNHAFDRQNRNNPLVDTDFLDAWRRDEPESVRAIDKIGSPTVWFERERANLLAVVGAAETSRPPLEITPKLACSLFYFLEKGGHFAEWEQAEESARRLAFAGRDRHDQARSLRNRGRLAMVKVLEEHERLRDESEPHPSMAGACSEAVTLLKRSRKLYRKEYKRTKLPRDRAGEVTTMRELADVYRLEIDPSRPSGHGVAASIRAYKAAERIYASMHNDNGLASLWLALGITYTVAGKYIDARYYLDRSLEYGALPDEQSEPKHARLLGFALRRLGDLHLKQKDLSDAISRYKESADVFIKDKDTIGAARALAVCGQVQATLGDFSGARRSLETARQLFAARALGDSDPEAMIATIWLVRLTS